MHVPILLNTIAISLFQVLFQLWIRLNLIAGRSWPLHISMAVCRQPWWLVCVYGLLVDQSEAAQLTSYNLPTTRLEERGSVKDLYLSTPDMILKNGYPVETHTVLTEDGYLLTVHRIPGSPKAPSKGVKTPVLLHHGVLAASDDWIVMGPNKGLGFLLADQGYDVWMANARGNFYSRTHSTLSPKDRKFWDFTWHEIGVYDVSAVIDYILYVTSNSQLFCIGHSMGTTVFLVLASVRPEYNKKIRLLIGFAAAVYNGQLSSVIQTFFRVSVIAGVNEILPRTDERDRLFELACRDGQALQNICTFAYFSTYGFSPKELNTTRISLYWSRILSGTSSATLQHILQNFEKARFQQFDRGAEGRGHTVLMPQYNLSMVTLPVVLIYSDNDAVIRPSGVLRLAKELPNVGKEVRLTGNEAISHRGFLFSDHVERLVYDNVINLLGQY